ncbi:MAG: DNA repair protein RadC [Clostridia bacterium]|nr:DNA repair protein RadC [Clostridia bacterium]
MPAKKNIHSGHRDRVRDRFTADGLESFADHNILELILFYSVPRRDTNELAHRLLEHFGSISAVLDASVERLTEVPGITYSTAVLLHLFPAVYKRYELSKYASGTDLNNINALYNYVSGLFIGESEEALFAVCLDGQNRLICSEKISSGSVNATAVSAGKILDCALRNKAAGLVIAHNHPGNNAMPSGPDIYSTDSINKALEAAKIMLQDHIIVGGDGKISSMRALGYIGY